ncbi:MAG: type VI secretion system protein TssA [Bryobacteraceae bacterium]|jgi:type VI secretion system protein ImpA
MPLRDDLLNPIPGDNPSGENLRYAAVYDKIKEGRREDDDAPQGDWQFGRKTADYPLVIKLASETLATKSKDLQVAAWLTEAILRKEGFPGLKSGLELIRSLIDNFWDTLYPELDDGDAEMRAAPLEWLGTRMEPALRSVPLTRKGANWFRYKESRAVGYEAAADTEAKVEARNATIAEGKMSGEEWDQEFAATPKAFYAGMEETLDGVLEVLESLSAVNEEKFGDVAPSFGPMRTTLEEVRHTVHGLLQKKRETEPDEGAAAPAAEPGEAAAPEPSAAAAAPAKPKPKAGPLTAEPVDKDDAFQRVAAVAAYLRREDPSSPAPYLLLRGLRWGELRAAGTDVDGNLLEAPPTGARQELKKAANDAEWQQVLELGESAMALPCGRGWLDLQRYVFRAANELGYYQIASAIRAEVNGLVADYPALRQATLLDDTQAANSETQAWLDEIAPAHPAAEAPYAPPTMEDATEASWAAPDGKPETIDANDLALEAARSGRPQEAIEILTREATAEKSGRGRFQRRLQLAQLCMSMGYERIAHPILEQLAAEIDSRGLEAWEAPSAVAHPLTLLYRCLEKLDTAPDLKQKIYDRICRLDPLQALACGR